MAKLDLIYNPVAGSFREKRLAAIMTALGREGFEVNPQPTRVDGIDISPDAKLVCVLGGDGTLRDCVQAMGERADELPLCIARSGTINLVARELGYNANPVKFARQLATAWARGPDGWLRSPLYRLGEVPIVSCLSVGPDSQAVARVAPALKQRIGRYAYVAAMLQQLRNWPRNVMAISGELASGERFACEAEAVIAARGAFYAGPFRLSPRAALAQDAIELITLRRATRTGMAAFSAAAMMGRDVERFDFVDIRTVRRVQLDRCVSPLQVDGDHLPGAEMAITRSEVMLRYIV